MEKVNTLDSSIIWTNTSPKSSICTIKKFLADNLDKKGVTKLLELLDKQDYLGFQRELGLMGNDLDGKLGISTYNRLKKYIVCEPQKSLLSDTLGLELNSNIPDNKSKDFVTWTETSNNSKLNEILSLLDNVGNNEKINTLVNLLENKEYKGFQKTLGMEPWLRDGKLGNLTLIYFDYYLRENNLIIGNTSQDSLLDTKELYNTEKKIDKKDDLYPNNKYEIDNFNIIVPSEIKNIWDSLTGHEKPELEPFACAMRVYNIENAEGNLKNKKYITIIDFTKNQLKCNRFFVINLDTKEVEYAEKCGHGKKSGDNERAKSFSNEIGSNQSSIGVFITPDRPRSNSKGTWLGSFLKGQESSNNALRGIAIHPVDSLIKESGELSSEGCFTVPIPQKSINEILSKINGGSLLFVYAKSKDYFVQSDYFQKDSNDNVII